tara:strand:- start:92 stop:2131 length:2040 start_codon:yes stop_codon:yes gene_type:complete
VLPGGPYSLLESGGARDDQSLVSVDSIATLIFDGDLKEACVGDYARCVYLEERISLSSPPVSADEVPTICLTMIVRNEAAIIERALERACSLVDAVCICDTGSTDSTREKAKAFLEKRGMDGVVFRLPFRDFGYNRTVSWLAARGLGTYQLFLDADHLLEVAPAFDKASLTAPSYLVQQTTHGCSYWNLRLGRDDGIVGCEGLTHEFWKPVAAAPPDQLTTLFINDIGDGGAKADKFVRDTALLERQLLYTPECPRTWFYLANTHRDRGDGESAIKAYRKRIALGGWPEEVWCSHLNIGRCNKRLGETDKAVGAWLDAYEVDSARIENLMDIIVHYREQKKFVLAARFCELALTAAAARQANPRLLFVEETAYRWRLDYEISIIQYYLGSSGAHLRPTADRALWRLLRRAPVPREHLVANCFFYATVLDEKPKQALTASPDDRELKPAWICTAPAPDGMFTISGWLDKEGRTTMLWSQTNQSDSVIGVLPAPGCGDDPPRIVVGEDLTLVTQVGDSILGHTIWVAHRQLSPAFSISGPGAEGGMESFALMGTSPHHVRSWYPFASEAASESSGGTADPLWRGTRPIAQCNTLERGPLWMLRLEKNNDEALYAVTTCDPKLPEKGAVSRAFRFPRKEDVCCGFWVEDQTLCVVSTNAPGKCELRKMEMSKLEWMPVEECV